MLRIGFCTLAATPFIVLGFCVSGKWVFMGPLFLVAAAIIFAFPVAKLIAEPVGMLFCPSERYDRPQPMYSIPESKKKSGHYEDAMTGFEKIAQDHPDEVKPYIEMIDIAIVNLHDAERANDIFQHGMSVLKKESDKQGLVNMYTAIRSRLK